MARVGMDRETGQQIEGIDHLSQSIGDILTTPFVTRVMRLKYGSALPDVIDAPQNSEAAIRAFLAVAEALDAWEPDFALERIATIAAEAGKTEIELTGKVTLDGVTSDQSVRVAV